MISEEPLGLEDIKKEPFIIEHIKWDAGPKELTEPSIVPSCDGFIKKEPLKGYIFYIDTMGDKPVLSLMRHTEAGFAETLAQIDEMPDELLAEAIEENKGKGCFGMYPINTKIKDRLKKELGVI